MIPHQSDARVPSPNAPNSNTQYDADIYELSRLCITATGLRSTTHRTKTTVDYFDCQRVDHFSCSMRLERDSGTVEEQNLVTLPLDILNRTIWVQHIDDVLCRRRGSILAIVYVVVGHRFTAKSHKDVFLLKYAN